MKLTQIGMLAIAIGLIAVLLVSDTGIHPDYVGLGVVIFQLMLLIFVKSKYFKMYLDKMEKDRKYNRKELGF